MFGHAQSGGQQQNTDTMNKKQKQLKVLIRTAQLMGWDDYVPGIIQERTWQEEEGQSASRAWTRNLREKQRQNNDPLKGNHGDRLARFAAPLNLADSLRAALNTLEEGGDAIAARVLRACEYRHARDKSLIGDFFAMRESQGLVSYCPTGRVQQLTDDGRWAREGRQAIKPAKWARALLSPHVRAMFKDHDFSAFASRFSAEEKAAELTVQELTIQEAYTLPRPGPSGDPVFISCMHSDRHESRPQYAVEFYETLGADTVTAWGVVDGRGQLHGRALVWQSVQSRHGEIILMDRVYGQPDVQELLFGVARSKGWYRKHRQGSGGTLLVSPEGETVSMGHLTVAVDWPETQYTPYMDTLRYYDTEEEVLTNQEPGGPHYELASTSGSYEECGGNRVQDVDGEWIDRDDAVEVDGDWYASDDDRICYVESRDEYCLACDCYEVTIGRTTYIVHEDQVNRLG